ncbi:MAG: hypothetical protein EOP79_04985 [Variovorax sp.]|nr:MAG: hypothetical protein EOP79_04985 [Variovorax sp.]
MQSLRHSRLNASLVIALVIALWLASTLGLMHRVVHGGAKHAVATQAFPLGGVDKVQGVSRAHAGGEASHGGVFALFGDHADADCRLYDQLAAGAAALSVPLVVLPIALPMARFHYFLGEALARWVSLFDARGPPLTR